MKTAIIGLPMTGKTSLFTILTGVHQETRIGSTSARTGIARVPDARVEALGKLFEPPKVTHATVEYVDMPSISKETLRDAGSIASLRNVEAFAHVLRLFASDTIPHEKGSVDPIRDTEDLETELILNDFAVLEKRLERLEKDRKKIKNPELDREYDLLVKCKAMIEDNKPLRELVLDAEDEKRIQDQLAQRLIVFDHGLALDEQVVLAIEFGVLDLLAVLLEPLEALFEDGEIVEDQFRLQVFGVADGIDRALL